jgi:hypothetical protein
MAKQQQQQPVHLDETSCVLHTYEYYWFAFYQGRLEGRYLKPHHLRDSVAFRELSVALDARGGIYVTRIPNGPATSTKIKHYKSSIRNLVNANENPLVEDVVDYEAVDESFLKRGQLLVVSTRIPMNDSQQEDKVQVAPGFTSLEQKIIQVCRPYLPVCARSRVRIADPLANQLSPEFADRADIQFHAYKEPWYTMLRTTHPGAPRRRPKRGLRRTAAYLLQLPEVEELNGADLLVMWGQGGTQTLAFAQLLRNDLSRLVGQYGFSMVEMEAPESDPFRLLDSLSDWKVHVLLEGVLLDPSGRRVCSPKEVTRGTVPPRGSSMKSVRRGAPGAKGAGSGG